MVPQNVVLHKSMKGNVAHSAGVFQYILIKHKLGYIDTHLQASVIIGKINLQLQNQPRLEDGACGIY